MAVYRRSQASNTHAGAHHFLSLRRIKGMGIGMSVSLDIGLVHKCQEVTVHAKNYYPWSKGRYSMKMQITGGHKGYGFAHSSRPGHICSFGNKYMLCTGSVITFSRRLPP